MAYNKKNDHSGSPEISIAHARAEILHFIKMLEAYPSSPRRPEWLESITKLKADIDYQKGKDSE